ncbi:MAG: superoxide dismutase [Deltaproteobacteria bacterium]|nr:superoxide dismutase [Deltaproteobacteria bacterium]
MLATIDVNGSYELPTLEYDYSSLAPYLSEEQLRIHYEKHHQAYINGANGILYKLEKARKDNLYLDQKSTLKKLSFNIGGHMLHSLFWGNLAPQGKGGGDELDGPLASVLNKEYGSVERFTKEFTQAAVSTEGSGWAALTYCTQTARPLIMQVEKHNTNIYPTFAVLMVLDMFEHAYYLDYQNDRAKFVDAFFHILNWNVVNQRFERLLERS